MILICQLLKRQAISLLITGLLMVQSIFAPEQYYLFAVILAVQFLRIALEYCKIPLFQMVPVLQYWSYLIILYYITQPNIMVCMCMIQLGHILGLLLDQELRIRKLVIFFQGGADLIVFFLYLNTSYIYLPCITIVLKMIVQYLNEPQPQEKFLMDQNQIPSCRVSQPQTPKNNSSQLELLSFFPQGITLIGLNDEILFCNENMKKIFQQGQETIIQAIFSLEEQQIMEQVEKPSMEQLKPSISSFSTFQPTPIPKTPFKAIARVTKASGTVIQQQLKEAPQQGFALFRARTQQKQDTLKIQDTFITDCCIIEQEVQYLKKQIQRKEMQNLMKNTQCLIQEHIVIMGYVHQDKQKRRQIEIKLYSCLINDQPSILIVARDITHRDYIRSLTNYSQQKSKMLSFVSHEFRNSLNCIIDQLNESLKDENRNRSETIFSEKDKENFKHIRIALDTTKQLLSLSDDLLDLAQIRVGKFKACKQKFNLFNLLKNCIELFSVTAVKRQIMLQLNYGHHVPKIVEQDPNRVKQIIINLLGNAFKFTHKGNITIEVTQGQDRKRITISVIDTGIGISDDDKVKIFKAFGKGNSEESKKMNEKGVGLGLLISNQILQNLNGDLQNGLKFNSQMNKGSTFYFSIQVSDLQEVYSLNCMEERNQESEDSEYRSQFVPEEEKPQQLKIAVKKNNQNNNIKVSTNVSIGDTKILVVDDVQLNADMIKRMMKDLSIDWALNGYQAIEKCEERWKQCQEFYKIILMDLEMPGMDGFETSKAIYQLCIRLGTQTTIIGCSAYDSQDEINECLKSGMKGYLQKPVQPKALREIIFKHL